MIDLNESIERAPSAFVFNKGDRVTISTHGDNKGTVLSADRMGVVVQMDGEPGPRLCWAENVREVT